MRLSSYALPADQHPSHPPPHTPKSLQVRAKTFYAEKLGVDVASVDIPVVGGHAGITILPLFSQATPGHSLKPEDIDALTKRTQDGGTEVVLAKAGKGSATLSMAYAAALFADACLRGLNGQVATECAYVESSVEPDVPFFASRVKLSTEGARGARRGGLLWCRCCWKLELPCLSQAGKPKPLTLPCNQPPPTNRPPSPRRQVSRPSTPWAA